MKEQLERRIVGAILLKDLQPIPMVLQVVSLDDFTFYREHMEIMFDSWKGQKDVWLMFKQAEIKSSEVFEMRDEVPIAFHLEWACAELKDIATSERIQRVLQRASGEVPQTNVRDFVAELQQTLIHQTLNMSQSSDIGSVIAEFRENQRLYEEKQLHGQELIGLSCGFSKIDRVIDGLRPGHIWTIGGYTSMGKTFLSLNIVNELIRQKKRVVFYTLEMSRVDLLSRTLGIGIGENGRAIAKGAVDQHKIEPELQNIVESGLTIISDCRELSKIVLSMHEQTLAHKVDLFVFDYIGLIEVKGARSEYEQMKAVAIELQEAGKRFGVPIIELSQVNNEAAKNGEQMVIGFKGAGDIAAAADLAIELVSGEETIQTLKTKMHLGEPVRIKCQIKKNRHGPTGYVLLEFDGKTGVFTEIDEHDF